MKKNRLVCLGFPLIAAMAVGCSSVDIEGLTSGDTQTEITTEETSTPEATEAASETEATESESKAAEDSEFYCKNLEENREEKVDLGSDGQMDTVFFKYPDGLGKDNICSLKVNDQTIDIELVVENGVLYGNANALLVHKSDGDFVLLSEGDATGYGSVTLYMWDKDSLKEVDKVSEAVKVYSNYDVNKDSATYEVSADKVCLASLTEFFGCSWIAVKDYTYGSDGLLNVGKETKVEPYIQGGEDSLILKKDITFMEDESGEGPKSAKAGQKIKPYDIKGSYMGFTSEDGQFLGYLEDVDNPEELFENIGYFRVG